MDTAITAETRKKRLKKGAQGWLRALPFILPGLILVAVFVVYPMLFTIRISLSEYKIVQGDITFIGLENFKNVLEGGSRFWYAYRNNFLYAIVTVPFIILGGMFFAYLINNLRRGQGIFRVGFYLPVITSWVAAAVVWQWVLSGKYGLLNQMLATVGIQGPAWLSSATWAMPGIVLASVWKDTGYYALMVLAALKSIDPGYYEAADLDGASGAKKFFSITLPLISPTLFLLIVINIIYGLQVFDSVLIMTDGGPGGATTVFLERIYKYAFVQYKMGMASTYACILFVVLLLFTAVQFWMQKRWVNYDA